MKVKDFIKQEEENTPLQERLKLVRKLFMLALEINLKGKHLVFFDLQPHVRAIDIIIIAGDDYKNWLFYKQLICYDADPNARTHEEMIAELKEATSELIKYLRSDD